MLRLAAARGHGGHTKEMSGAPVLDKLEHADWRGTGMTKRPM